VDSLDFLKTKILFEDLEADPREKQVQTILKDVSRLKFDAIPNYDG
jgi:hypothetical protein